MKSNKYKVKATFNNSLRHKSTREKLEIVYPCLDAGCKNGFAESLGIMHFVDTDLNYPFLVGKFQTITSFDIIEHLQNPLLYLHSIYNNLSDGGCLYLTTPVKWIFKGKYHFHEFTEKELLFCLKEAGFKDIEITRIKAYTLSHFGIRPIIKKLRDIIYGQCFFVKCSK